jgi:hypothetical protein
MGNTNDNSEKAEYYLISADIKSKFVVVDPFENSLESPTPEVE